MKDWMRFFVNLAIYAIVYGCLIANEFYGLTYAGNLAIFVVWFFALGGFLAIFFLDGKELNEKKGKLSGALMVIRYLMIAALAVIGWTFTAAFYLIVSITLDAKRTAAKALLAGEAQ